MRICNNKDGLPDCYGGCYDSGLCTSKCECENSLIVDENLIKLLMKESRRHQYITHLWKKKTKEAQKLMERGKK